MWIGFEKDSTWLSTRYLGLIRAHNGYADYTCGTHQIESTQVLRLKVISHELYPLHLERKSYLWLSRFILVIYA